MKGKTIGKIGAAAAVTAAACTAVEYAVYRSVFYSPNKGQNDDHRILVPIKTQEMRQRSIELIDALNARPYEEVFITSFDGLKLRGRYYHAADGAPTAILCHGYRGTPSRDFCGGADICFNAGMNVLLIEERAHCGSEGHTVTFGVKERYDILFWTRYIVERLGKDVEILLAGISMGASAVLLTAGLDLPPNVKGLLADCPFSSAESIIKTVGERRGFPMKYWYPNVVLVARLFGGFSPEPADSVYAARLAKIPVLLIHGEEDRLVPCDMSRKIAEANPEMVEFHTFPGAGHGLSYLEDTERYTSIVNDFCARIFSDGQKTVKKNKRK